MKKKTLVILAVMLVVLLGAELGYSYLSKKYAPAPVEEINRQERSSEKKSKKRKNADAKKTVEEEPEEKTEESAEQLPDAPVEEAQPEAPAEPEPEPKELAPDFTVLDMEGNPVKLSEQRGKPVVLNFWATWCSPCRSELPAFLTAYHTYGDELTFMMVNLTDGARETRKGVMSFLRENELDFPAYFDTEYEAANAYAVYSIPLSVFLDADGALVDSHLGAMDESTLQSYLDLLLN